MMTTASTTTATAGSTGTPGPSSRPMTGYYDYPEMRAAFDALGGAIVYESDDLTVAADGALTYSICTAGPSIGDIAIHDGGAHYATILPERMTFRMHRPGTAAIGRVLRRHRASLGMGR